MPQPRNWLSESGVLCRLATESKKEEKGKDIQELDIKCRTESAAQRWRWHAHDVLKM